jgi:ABC-2 type transport system permease protein
MGRWLRDYPLMLKWQMLSNTPMLVLMFVVEGLIAVGYVIGFGYIIPNISAQSAMYLITGAPVLILLMVGLVLVPQVVSMARKEGTFEYIWSLPVPRSCFMAADATVWMVITLPGVLLAVIVGAWHYHFSLHVSPLVVPTFLLVTLTGIFIGYALAHSVPKPEITMVLSQILVFFVLIFSPIYYPIEQLPNWLASIHRVLPFKYMADLMRGYLTGKPPSNVGLAFAVVGAWCAASMIVASIAVKRRG